MRCRGAGTAATDAMRGGAVRCELVRACISIGCEKQRESPLQRRIACVGTRPIREAARALFVGDGRMERKRLAEPESGGVAEKWAADRAPASEAPARPTPASAQRLLVGSGWAGSGLGSGLGGGLAAKWALTWFLV